MVRQGLPAARLRDGCPLAAAQNKRGAPQALQAGDVTRRDNTDQEESGMKHVFPSSRLSAARSRAAAELSTDMAALGRQFAQCRASASRWAQARELLQRALAYPGTHFVTTLLVAVLAVEAGLSWF